MPVPDYQSLMAATVFFFFFFFFFFLLALTEEDLRAKIPSGTPLLANRLHWAITYIYQAGWGLPSQARRGPDY